MSFLLLLTVTGRNHTTLTLYSRLLHSYSALQTRQAHPAFLAVLNSSPCTSDVTRLGTFSLNCLYFPSCTTNQQYTVGTTYFMRAWVPGSRMVTYYHTHQLQSSGGLPMQAPAPYFMVSVRETVPLSHVSRTAQLLPVTPWKLRAFAQFCRGPFSLHACLKRVFLSYTIIGQYHVCHYNAYSCIFYLLYSMLLLRSLLLLSNNLFLDLFTGWYRGFTWRNKSKKVSTLQNSGNHMIV